MYELLFHSQQSPWLETNSFRAGLSSPLATFSLARSFSTTSPTLDWLTPKFAERSKSPKGRPKVATGGSTRGTTVVWGDYGIRMKDHDRRMPSSALKIAEETIKRRLRGMNYKLYKRVSANIGVYTKGNEQRMGKGKGKFDYWTVRLPVSRVVFELKGDIHEKVAREAFRLAGHKLPGTFYVLETISNRQSQSWYRDTLTNLL